MKKRRGELEKDEKFRSDTGLILRTEGFAGYSRCTCAEDRHSRSLHEHFRTQGFSHEPTAVHRRCVLVGENRGEVFLVTQDAAHKGFFR